jgi:hypothetical protein
VSAVLELDFARQGRAWLDAVGRINWPDPRWQHDPVGFFRTILGIEPWSKQRKLLEAFALYRRIACHAGRKVSKTNSEAGLALWFYCSFEDAAVTLLAPTNRQVNGYFWTEVRRLVARSGRCVECRKADPHGPRPCPHAAVITGDIHELASSGLKSTDFRQIVGYVTGTGEAMQGPSGKNQLYLLDEASGISDFIFTAVKGNCAGGGWIGEFGNPTASEGEFYRHSVQNPGGHYDVHHISSLESPNITGDEPPVEGLATEEWVQEMVEEWGEDSALFKIHVKGEFVEGESGRIITAAAIAAAEARWEDTSAEGPLYVGLDPAGEGGLGDETVYVARRGSKMLAMEPHTGLSEEMHLAHLIRFLAEHRQPREVPTVVLDREGSIGAPLYGVLKSYSESVPGSFKLIGFRASDAPTPANVKLYGTARDELYACGARWIKQGGAILEDARLKKDLHAPEWGSDHKNRLKATPKRDLRKILGGRSPDRGEALFLSTWEARSLRDDADIDNSAHAESRDELEPLVDPYEAAMAMQRL